MGSKQASKAMRSESRAAQRPGQSSPPTGSARQRSPATGERDENYDLISVLYHALQGAETVGQYLADAQQADDEELMEFFEDTRAEFVARAREAKELLASRLSGEEGSADADEDEEDEDAD